MSSGMRSPARRSTSGNAGTTSLDGAMITSGFSLRRHLVAVQPEFLRAITAHRRALEGPVAHLADRRRRMIPPAIRAAQPADQRERRLVLKRFSLPPDSHQRGDIRIRMVAQPAGD